MSRLKKFTHSLATGYLQLVVQALYTFASIPLALHYLSTQQFGLWQIAMTVAGYLVLIDLGMTASSGRIVMDYKDKPAGGAYGSAIKISAAVFFIQGIVIAFAGTLLSFWLPQLVNVQAQFPDPAEAQAASHVLIILSAGQCIVLGIFFPGRVFGNLLVAHQRYDLGNLVQIGSLLFQFATLWLSFREHLGIYSVLAASVTGLLFNFFGNWFAAARCGFFPPRGKWGQFDFKLFKEIFFLGGNVFLMAVGAQLINASQVIIIGNTLGLTAAAVWAVATKPFLLAQQLVGRIVTFSSSPMSEMIVRGETERFIKRLRDLMIVYSAAAIFIGGSIALCNEDFLKLWLRHRDILPDIDANWNSWNDFLLALWLAVTCVTTLHVSVITYTKKIGRMRYVYFCEGLIFVTTAFWVAPHFGISGIIIAAIFANVLCSGIFGIRCTVNFFRVPMREVVFGWLARPVKFLVLFALLLFGCKFSTLPLNSLPRFGFNATIAGACGLWLLWRVALTKELRNEILAVAQRFSSRIKSGSRLWQKSN